MEDKPTPQEVMVGLFAGKSPAESKALLASLERGGASVYRTMAQAEDNTAARDALLAAAKREEENAKLLETMTQLKPQCEKCGRATPRGAQAYTCSFQCTFCPECAGTLAMVCPNCGGPLRMRQTPE